MDIRSAVFGLRAHERFANRVAELDLPAIHAPSAVVTETDLASLPEPARRYLRFMGVVRRPRDWSFQARFRGHFRMKRGQRWMPFGTYVNDALMVAPSMLRTPTTRWVPVDDHGFDIVFNDEGNTVTARVFIDDAGRLIDFRTDDRWYAGVTPPARTPWTTPVTNWTHTASGRPVPADGAAVWQFSDGEFAYVRGAFDSPRPRRATTKATGVDSWANSASRTARV